MLLTPVYGPIIKRKIQINAGGQNGCFEFYHITDRCAWVVIDIWLKSLHDSYVFFFFEFWARRSFGPFGILHCNQSQGWIQDSQEEGVLTLGGANIWFCQFFQKELHKFENILDAGAQAPGVTRLDLPLSRDSSFISKLFWLISLVW